jgi:hypothetical protein
MLGSKDLFDKSRGFGKCAAKLDVQPLFYEHGSSKAVRVEIVAQGILQLGAIWSEEVPTVVEIHISTGVFEIYLDIMKQSLRNQQSLRWRRRMRIGEESSDVITIELENEFVVGEWGCPSASWVD